MDIPAVIKEFRKEMGLSQAALGEQAGLSTTYISELESGKKSPTLKSLKKISEVLEIPFPILSILAMEQEDIHPDKQEAYKLIEPSLKALIAQLIDKKISH